MKKILYVLFALAIAVPLLAAQEDVVKQLLPDADMKPVIYSPAAADTAKIQAALGSKAAVRAKYEIYASKTGVVVIEEQMGKWSVIKTAILFDTATKKVKSVAIISMNEKRGAAVKAAAFLSQFAGKGSADTIEVGKGIKGASGATVTSKAVTLSVKRAIIVYELYAAKGK